MTIQFQASYQVIHRQKDFIVIDKSPGVSVHKDQAELGLLQTIQQELELDKLYLVHRLDKMTSGLLLLALNQKAASDLSALFAQRLVDKSYLALSDKKPSKKQGLIKGDMVTTRGGSWRLSQSKSNPAITRFYSTSCGQGKRLFLLNPLTGKTHQLRVALKSIGSPIIGDHRYHNKTQAQCHDRGYLHAWQLAFEYAGQKHCYESKPSYGALFLDASFDLSLLELQQKLKNCP